MKIIYKERGKGKTLDLIKISNQDHLYLVVRDMRAVEDTVNLAKFHNLDIPYPLTYEEFIKKQYYGKGIKGFLIDDAEILLQYLSSSVPIKAITITKEPINGD